MAGPGEVRALRRLASTDADPAVARRAALVLASLQGAEPSRSRRTAQLWRERWEELGRDGLRDRPRPGRPRGTVADQVLLAPLGLRSERVSSHRVADACGVSQSTVARVWREAYDGDAPAELVGRRWALVGAVVAGGRSALVLADSGAGGIAASAAFLRSPRRPTLQVLLAGDLVAAPGRVEVARLVADVRETHRGDLLVLGRRAAAGVDVVLDAGAWQRLLPALVATGTALDALTALHRRMLAWDRSAPLVWVAPAPRPPERAATRRAPKARSTVIADDVLAAVHRRLAEGRLAAGDRITESSLAREVHASRSQVHDALLALGAASLVDLEPHRGACVPTPAPADVIETYAVRRALGTLLVRRAAAAPAGALAPAREALDELVRIGRSGDSRTAGSADIAFQDALARCTRMRRIPAMFETLSAQIWMFCAVLGVRYAYAIDAMVADDTALLEHVLAQDEAAAVAAWHSKMDDALSYMLGQLEPARQAPVS